MGSLKTVLWILINTHDDSYRNAKFAAGLEEAVHEQLVHPLAVLIREEGGRLRCRPKEDGCANEESCA